MIIACAINNCITSSQIVSFKSDQSLTNFCPSSNVLDITFFSIINSYRQGLVMHGTMNTIVTLSYREASAFPAASFPVSCHSFFHFDSVFVWSSSVIKSVGNK